MADFDDWDLPQEGQGPVQEPPLQGDDDDGWGSFGSDDDWGTPTQSDDFTPDQGDFSSQPGIQPGGQQIQQGGFIQQDEDGWGSTSGIDETTMGIQNPNDFASSEVNVQEYQPKRLNLSMKKVALIILAACVVVALVFLGLDKIHITKKPSQPSSNQPQQSNSNQTQQQGVSNNTQQGSTNTSVEGVTLIEIPDTVSLDYNGDIMEANGKVINKLKYVQSHQVLYCINIGVALGSSSETVSYYCNYSSYNAVKEGDIVVLRYQQVNDTYISVISISK